MRHNPAPNSLPSSRRAHTHTHSRTPTQHTHAFTHSHCRANPVVGAMGALKKREQYTVHISAKFSQLHGWDLIHPGRTHIPTHTHTTNTHCPKHWTHPPTHTCSCIHPSMFKHRTGTLAHVVKIQCLRKMYYIYTFYLASPNRNPSHANRTTLLDVPDRFQPLPTPNPPANPVSSKQLLHIRQLQICACPGLEAA